jgi:hypothetical protein
MNSIVRGESEGSILGVPGRFMNVVADDKIIRNQKWVSERRKYSHGRLQVEVRYDDQCKNGHCSFAITGTTYDRDGREDGGGCCHDIIAEAFPELAQLIQWHLTSSDGPMHYIANVVYHAGNRDHNGLLAGEVRQLRNGKTGLLSWKLESTSELPKYVDSDERPPQEATLRYVPWTRTGEGKKREFNHARSTAVWPEATDEELSVEPEELRKVLRARLPALLERFKKAILDCGFMEEPPESK